MACDRIIAVVITSRGVKSWLNKFTEPVSWATGCLLRRSNTSSDDSDGAAAWKSSCWTENVFACVYLSLLTKRPVVLQLHSSVSLPQWPLMVLQPELQRCFPMKLQDKRDFCRTFRVTETLSDDFFIHSICSFIEAWNCSCCSYFLCCRSKVWFSFCASSQQIMSAGSWSIMSSLGFRCWLLLHVMNPSAVNKTTSFSTEVIQWRQMWRKGELPFYPQKHLIASTNSLVTTFIMSVCKVLNANGSFKRETVTLSSAELTRRQRTSVTNTHCCRCVRGIWWQ